MRRKKWCRGCQSPPSHRKAQRVPVAKKKYPVVLPYDTGISAQLRRVFRSFYIPAYFKLTNTLRQLLVQPKDKVMKDKVVGPVYQITCDDCDAMFVGEMERSLKTQFKTQFLEHKMKNSVGGEVSQHAHG